jgi:hypothetical protein
VEQSLSQRHQRALRLAESSFDLHEPGTARDVSLSWTLAQVLGEDNDPLA